MVLEDLHALIETLRDRITKHGPALRQSESLTRYALIDPLLRELGWDTSDPAHVLVEFRSGSGSADYALLGPGATPRVIVEAKKLDTPLQSAVSQVINYCIMDGYEYFAVTDGQRWQLYGTNHPGPLADKLVMQLDLAGSAAETCLDALALWRPSVVAGDVKTGATPIVDMSAPATNVTENPEPLPQLPSPGGEWRTIATFKPVSGSKPASVRFPGGETRDTVNWADFIAEIVGWLRTNRMLTDDDLPIHLGKKFFLDSTPPDLKNTTYRQIDSWFVKTNFTGGMHASNAREVIKLAGLNPADFAVRLAE